MAGLYDGYHIPFSCHDDTDYERIMIRSMNKYFMLLFLSLQACSGKPYPVAFDKTANNDETETVYISNHGWHTGFIIDAKSIEQNLPFLNERFKNAKYYEIGWGDHDYYQNPDPSIFTMLKALLWPTDTVMHVVAVPYHPVRYFSHSDITKFQLNPAAYKSLLTYIQSSFFYGKENKVVTLATGLYGDGQFYKSVGDFSMLNTCNIWTAKGLKSAGFDISPVVYQTASSIMSYIKKAPASLKTD